MKLDRLVHEARNASSDWTSEREARVLAATLQRHEARTARSRFARRVIGLAGATAIVTFFFLRTSSASLHPEPGSVVATEELANGDGGYGRD